MDVNSIAAGVGVSVKNAQFQAEALNLPRKILLLGTFSPAKDTLAENVPVQVLSPEDAGDRTGFGFPLHRLARAAFRDNGGVPVFLLPQAEPEGASAAEGELDFAGSAGVKAGTIPLYIDFDLVPVPVAAGSTAAQIATKVAAAINALKYLPVTAEAADTSVTITSKAKGVWGNSTTLAFALGYGEALPTGVVAAVTAMSGGAGTPDIDAALAALGTGDSANEDHFTDVVNGYGQVTAALDAFSAYVGAGNEAVGLYANTVGRPFRVLCGDTAKGSDGLAALVALADGRKLDRANGVIAAPGSMSHPAEVAAAAMGSMARVSQDRVAQSYVDIALLGIHPGDKADRWSTEYTNRDIAVKGGFSPTIARYGALLLQNVVSFYRPDNVPVTSNGYRSMRNIAIIQNLLYNIRLNFEQEKWQGISIVADVAAVGNIHDREKARDIDSVIDDLLALTNSFVGRAWIFSADYTIRRLKEAGSVSIRQGGVGFDNILAVILSGEGGILNTAVEFDTSLAVLLN